jgi:hypothetical protein
VSFVANLASKDTGKAESNCPVTLAESYDSIPVREDPSPLKDNAVTLPEKSALSETTWVVVMIPAIWDNSLFFDIIDYPYAAW